VSGATPACLPLAAWPRSAAAAVDGVLTDIDDTLTRAGKIAAETLGALEELRDAGIKIVPVTGGPASLALHAARLWPVAAAIGESGAVAYWHDGRRLHARYWHDDAAERARLAARRDAFARALLAEQPGLALAADQCFRLCDLALDICEDVEPLADAQVAVLAARLRAAGMTVRQSSIHLNAWWGDYDKLPMARRLLRQLWGQDLDDPAVRARWAYVGDAPNDAPMFGFFEQGVGVANIAPHLAHIEHAPRYVTAASHGAGFVEFAHHLLAARQCAA
jgi:HAD superfamily hydrolase (TIGR01484 family)